jgi:hypothetical protein
MQTIILKWAYHDKKISLILINNHLITKNVMIKKTVLTFSLALIFLQCAVAQWNNNPEENMILLSGTGITNVASVKTSDNKIFVSYFYKESDNYNLYAQLLDADGYKLWDENGLLISSHPQDINPEPQQMLCDNDDNLVIVMTDKRQNADLSMFCYKLSQEGDFLWGSDGLCIFENNNNDWVNSISAFCDSENEIIASIGILGMETNSVYLQRIMSDQTLPWGLQGKSITDAESQQVFSSGQHIVAVFKEITGSWLNPDISILYQLYDKDGTPVFEDKQMVTDAGGITMFDDYDAMMTANYQTVITWHDDRNQAGSAKPYAQCIDVNGNTLWEANGICLSQEASVNNFYPMVAGQGSDNDVVFIWQKTVGELQWQKAIYGQKVTETGNLAWGNDGKELLAQCDNFHKINGCIMDENNFFVAFGLHPTQGYFDTVYTHLDSYGIANGMSNWGQPVQFATSGKSKGFFNLPMICNEQILVTWMEGDFEPTQEVKGQNIWFDGTLGLSTGQTTVEKNHFSMYPNPAIDYCHLKYNGADIESVLIINAQGVVIYKQKVNTHNPGINVSGLKKGLYFVKINTTDNKVFRSKLVKE